MRHRLMAGIVMGTGNMKRVEAREEIHLQIEEDDKDTSTRSFA